MASEVMYSSHEAPSIDCKASRQSLSRDSGYKARGCLKRAREGLRTFIVSLLCCFGGSANRARTVKVTPCEPTDTTVKPTPTPEIQAEHVDKKGNFLLLFFSAFSSIVVLFLNKHC